MLENYTDNISICKLQKEDIYNIYTIENECFSIPWSIESFINDFENNKCARYLGIFKNDKLIGYIGVWIILDEGHINNIAIAKNFQSKGYGDILFKSFLEYCSSMGVQYITLEVRKSNIVAQNLYKKYGFLKLATRKNYYKDNGEDAFLMVCDKLPPVISEFDDNKRIFKIL